MANGTETLVREDISKIRKVLAIILVTKNTSYGTVFTHFQHPRKTAGVYFMYCNCTILTKSEQISQHKNDIVCMYGTSKTVNVLPELCFGNCLFTQPSYFCWKNTTFEHSIFKVGTTVNDGSTGLN